MNALAIHRDQGRTSDRAGQPITRGGSRRSSGADHHQSHSRQSSRAPTGRRFAVGRFFTSAGDVLEFESLRRAGLRDEIALANLCPQIGHQASNQFADAAEVTHVNLLSIAPNDLEAIDGENGRVPIQRGKLPDQRGELPNVGSR